MKVVISVHTWGLGFTCNNLNNVCKLATKFKRIDRRSISFSFNPKIQWVIFPNSNIGSEELQSALNQKQNFLSKLTYAKVKVCLMTTCSNEKFVVNFINSFTYYLSKIKDHKSVANFKTINFGISIFGKKLKNVYL